MKAITGDKGCYVGMAVQNKSLIQTTHEEMNKILVVAVIMIFVVLCLATTGMDGADPVFAGYGRGGAVK